MPTNVNVVLSDEAYRKLTKLKDFFDFKNLVEAVEHSIRAAYDKDRKRIEGTE